MRLLARLPLIPLALCWLLMLASIPAALAQKRKTPELPPAPPPVVSREATVFIGESVEIPLGIHGRRTGQLEFLARNRPQVGKLSRITSTGLNSGAVTYTAPAETAATEDRFTYAVRSIEGVSAPGVVTVRLMRKPVLPGRLEAPESLAFPKVVLGEESAVSFEIHNPGAGMVTGEMSVNPPWSLEGSPAYKLEPKGRATYRLLFRPEKAGTVTGEVVLGPQPRRVIALTAEAQPPFVIKPSRVTLAAAEGRTRRGMFEIENLTADRATVALSTDPRLMTEKTVEVAAAAKVQVPVFAEPGDGSAFQDVVRVRAGDWNQDVAVEVEPLKQRVKLMAEEPDALRGKAGQPAEFAVVVENEGGRAAKVVLSANPPFAVAEPSLTINPGEKKRVTIAANAIEAGESRVEVSAQTDTAIERVQLVFIAAAEPSPMRAAAPTRPTGAVLGAVERPAQPVSAEDGAAELRNIAPRETSLQLADHPNALGDFVVSVGTDRATLAWPLRLGGASGVEVEERTMALGPNRKLVVNWARLQKVSFHTDTDPYRLELTELEPGKLHTVRVRSGGETLLTVQFATRPEPPLYPFTWRQTVVALLMLVLAVIGWRRWKSRQRSAW